MASKDLLVDLEGMMPADKNFDLVLPDKLTLIDVKVGDKIYMVDMVDHMTDNELNKVLKIASIKTSLARDIKKDIVKKIVRDIYVSDSDYNSFSAGAITCFIILLMIQIVLVITFIVFTLTYY
jgi:hypothetical protein